VAALTDELRVKADEIVARYPHRRSALLPLLYLVQAEQGHVTQEGMREVAEIIGLTMAEVEAVATYYTMFKKHPTGSWVLSICTNLSCALAGGRMLYDRAVEVLGEQAREVTSDEALTLDEVECLGACDAAPVVQVNYCNYDRVTEDRLAEMIEALRRDDPPEPSRGPTPLDHVATSRLLSGLRDGDG
jgi:NADH-quinone oxidoreductase subunit E